MYFSYSCHTHPSGFICGKAAHGGEGVAMDVAAKVKRSPVE